MQFWLSGWLREAATPEIKSGLECRGLRPCPAALASGHGGTIYRAFRDRWILPTRPEVSETWQARVYWRTAPFQCACGGAASEQVKRMYPGTYMLLSKNILIYIQTIKAQLNWLLYIYVLHKHVLVNSRLPILWWESWKICLVTLKPS